jgi:hypothetical protein
MRRVEQVAEQVAKEGAKAYTGDPVRVAVVVDALWEHLFGGEEVADGGQR